MFRISRMKDVTVGVATKDPRATDVLSQIDHISYVSPDPKELHRPERPLYCRISHLGTVQ